MVGLILASGSNVDQAPQSGPCVKKKKLICFEDKYQPQFSIFLLLTLPVIRPLVRQTAPINDGHDTGTFAVRTQVAFLSAAGFLFHDDKIFH